MVKVYTKNTMSKLVLWSSVGSFIILVVFLAWGSMSFLGGTEETEIEEREEVTVSGIVSAINLDSIAFDGPALVTLQTEGEQTEIIAIPSMGLQLCPAASAIADVYMLEGGDAISVRGERDEEGRIVPCESAEHYLLATAVYTDSSLGFQFTYRKGLNGYVLLQPETQPGTAMLREELVLMLQNDYEILQHATDAREGPPTITIRVFENTLNQWATTWTDAHPAESNVNLALAEPEELAAGGANAVRYLVDGLYPTDTVVIASGGYIYILSGSYLEEDSVIRADFLNLLDTFTFAVTDGE